MKNVLLDLNIFHYRVIKFHILEDEVVGNLYFLIVIHICGEYVKVI